MREYPRKLRNLFIYEDAEASVLGYLEGNFFVRTSDIMRDFLKICEKMNTEEIKEYLSTKYSERLIEMFFKKVESYSKQLFADDEEQEAFQFAQTIKNLTLNISHKCNLRCDYCFEELEFRKADDTMTPEIALEALELFLGQLGDNQGTVTFTGGEPLLNFKTIEAVVNRVLAVGKKNIQFFIKTNGILVTTEIMEYLMEHNFLVQVSLDGVKEAHDFHRKNYGGHGTFDKVIEVITEFSKRGYAHNLMLNGTVTHNTMPYLAQSLQLMKSFKGLHAYSLKPVMASDGQEYIPTEEDLKEYTKTIFKMTTESMASRGTLTNTALDKNLGICGIGVWHISVDIDGTIYPCYRLSGLPEYVLGHINNGLQLTLPEKLEKLYTMRVTDKCEKCFADILCKKGCYANKLLNWDKICNGLEKRSGDYILVDTIIKNHLYSMLPTI